MEVWRLKCDPQTKGKSCTWWPRLRSQCWRGVDEGSQACWPVTLANLVNSRFLWGSYPKPNQCGQILGLLPETTLWHPHLPCCTWFWQHRRAPLSPKWKTSFVHFSPARIMCVCSPCMCLVSAKVRRRHRISWNQSYGRLWATVWEMKSWAEKGGSVVRNSRSHKGPTLMLCTQGGRKKIKNLLYFHCI